MECATIMPESQPYLKEESELSYYIRRMCHDDIDQVTEIDREAFPTMWPPANYERELKVSLAHYITACGDGAATEKTKEQKIVGFAGLWMIADEAHITNIAVRHSYQRQGIGEHLLIAMINLAIEQNAHILTLEVRASNTAAQKLYHKYGFTQIDIRRSYYTDNREDALIMTIGDIAGAVFQRRLHRLKKAHSRKWGRASYHIF
ncbi:MAG: ribosomal protein S18-alanine N-acetyltransferase [Dehalococcoidales bacterium]|nr:ribosomal protein S18-alanine N-acetyltransferase [Dehalococcoidales bacterium]